MRLHLFLLFTLTIFSLNAQKVFKSQIEQRPDSEPWKTVYLIGDAGEDEDDQSGIAIMAPMLQEDADASVVLLGVNI